MREAISSKEESIRNLTLKERNDIQRELIKRSGKTAQEWIDENSDRFRELVNDSGMRQIIILHPEEAISKIGDILEDQESLGEE